MGKKDGRGYRNGREVGRQKSGGEQKGREEGRERKGMMMRKGRRKGD